MNQNCNPAMKFLRWLPCLPKTIRLFCSERAATRNRYPADIKLKRPLNKNKKLASRRPIAGMLEIQPMQAPLGKSLAAIREASKYPRCRSGFSRSRCLLRCGVQRGKNGCSLARVAAGSWPPPILGSVCKTEQIPDDTDVIDFSEVLNVSGRSL